MKNALISGILGLLFMVGGFAVGFKMMPKQKPVVIAPPAPTEIKPAGAAVAIPAPDAITMATLKKTSQSMMDLNLALADREKRVTEREAKLQQEESEMSAERVAMNSSHEKFKAMFNDFQNRLELVEANQQEQLQKQAELYNAMGPDQAIELIRATDDSTVTRLFSVMDTKPLAKLVSSWKTKYPDDSTRLLRTLANTGNVIDKNKVAMTDTMPAAAPEAAPAPAAAPAPEATPAPAPADATAPAPTTSTDTTTPATTPATAPEPGNPSAPQPLAPPPDVPAPKAPAQQSNPATTDDTTAPRALPVVIADPTTPGSTADAANIPVAQPISVSDQGVVSNLQPPRATPVKVTSTTSN